MNSVMDALLGIVPLISKSSPRSYAIWRASEFLFGVELAGNFYVNLALLLLVGKGHALHLKPDFKHGYVRHASSLEDIESPTLSLSVRLDFLESHGLTFFRKWVDTKLRTKEYMFFKQCCMHAACRAPIRFWTGTGSWLDMRSGGLYSLPRGWAGPVGRGGQNGRKRRVSIACMQLIDFEIGFGQVPADSQIRDKFNEFWDSCVARIEDDDVYKLVFEENDVLLEEARNLKEEIAKRIQEQFRS